MDIFASLTKGTKLQGKRPSALIDPDVHIHFEPPTAAQTDETTSAARPRKRARKSQDGLPAPTPAQVSAAIRKRHKIRMTGEDVPDPLSSFAELVTLYGCEDSLLDCLATMGHALPTPIQAQALPLLLKDHTRDLVACAPTGSGKTLAFLIPLLAAVQSSSSEPSNRIRALVIEPTRELARQVGRQADLLAQGSGWRTCVMGEEESGVSESLTADLLITTPLRLIYAIKAKTVDLSTVEHLILDEADRLFELNFLEQTDELIAACNHPKLRKALFSATIPSGVELLAKTIMREDAARVIVGSRDSGAAGITQQLTFVGSEDGKLASLRSLIAKGGLSPPVLIFTQSIERAQDLYRELSRDGLPVEVVHSDRSKEERDRAVQRFEAGRAWFLICTDVMARGIDFQNVNLVLNYDFPQGAANYIHRIGRTGRGGKEGKAITFFTQEDAVHLRSIVNILRNSGIKVDDWMLKLKAPSQRAKRNHLRAPVKRRHIRKAAKGTI
ncbi:uncharacterized protein L969DRAFT_26056 [Mixia osmundae IAM 14324]|uniref:RNA helicase n=1 Tax=Mixia osmundae (strain CBS 9802 / IAM 14324 / JCM 22182 / KY 12970) TaxID=764103 RepID=G7DZG6_MIXOS|nr:uncharacterized protein L969DRAFT_26056 [Mixia osmundae IAM 14324]KEI37147.1 hypothetical protein L969DRAFT_26056 [Mixia osmundae IAM 14324]GAA95976.1 hypothetical protein E5Q_02634 [Mixia osmundae IAM 14324]